LADLSKSPSIHHLITHRLNPHLQRYWRYSHGTTWAELCDDLLVVDVPGDHFSLLRQEPPDMEPLVRGCDEGVWRRFSTYSQRDFKALLVLD
jgi:hypothetical protein